MSQSPGKPAKVVAATIADEDNDDEQPQQLANSSAVGDNDADAIITLNDVLDEQKELDLEYAAVLGGSDHKSCTYAKVSAMRVLAMRV